MSLRSERAGEGHRTLVSMSTALLTPDCRPMRLSTDRADAPKATIEEGTNAVAISALGLGWGKSDGRDRFLFDSIVVSPVCWLTFASIAF